MEKDLHFSMPIFNNSLTLFSQKSVEGSFLSAGLGVKSLNYTDRNLIDDYDSLHYTGKQ